MSRYKKIFFTGLLTSFLWSSLAIAQVTHSPYSSIGIGDLQDPTTAAKFGMAGLGVSNGTYYSLNIVNPALLHYNRVALFSAAVLGETKTINQSEFEPYAAGSGQLNHMALAFPLISGKLSTALVLNPYSAVNYDVFFQTSIEGGSSADSVFVTAKGDGGIDQLSLSFGGELFKGLSLGVKASYMFSSIRKESKSVVPVSMPLSNNYVATVNERLSFQDFMFGLGLAYNFKIGETSSINFGTTYDFKADIKSKLFIRLDQELLSGTTVFADTLADNIPISVTLPEKLAIGLSYNHKHKFIIGFDYSVQDWTKSNLMVENNLGKREKFVLGAEVTPNMTSINNYFKRMTYRMGASFTNTPYIFGDTQITDFGINFGLSLPVVRFSSLDFGFQMGTRGTLTNNLIRENYFKLYFGVSFNDNRWFLQPKFN